MALTHVVLTSGRSIELMELQLSSTYGRFLEGYPCERVNEMKIRGLLRAAEAASPTIPVHLVPPPRERRDGESGPFGPVEILPPVACVGTFRSTAMAPDHDPVLYRSALTVVWFQQSPQAPSGDRADAGLRSVPWEKSAQDYEL
ncbi:hypothetical protein [Streptomyces sp. NPDC020298]|uniref:hypothetical protein n=1 Tax=unclassified Streptomyces TaxID=2593676 RepID=UPI00340E532C